MKLGLISDTHGQVPNAVHTALAGVDYILHAGDVGPMDVITELEAIAPVHAVLGNTDYGITLAGDATGRARRENDPDPSHCRCGFSFANRARTSEHGEARDRSVRPHAYAL